MMRYDMKTFRELYIHLGGNSPDTFFKVIEENLSENWRREKMDVDEAFLDETPSASCYQHSQHGNLPGAYLYIAEKKTSMLHVSNIIPLETGQLTYDAYNAILTDFFENVLKPTEERLNVSIKITEPEIRLDDILSSECSKLFKAFSRCANKSAGSSYLPDQEKWFSFIRCVNKNSEKIDPDIVEKLLIDDGWPEDRAIDLSSEFEFGVSLLNFHHKAEECHA